MPRSATRAGMRKCWRWQNMGLPSIQIRTWKPRPVHEAGGFTFLRVWHRERKNQAPLPFTIVLFMYSAQLLDHFQNPRNVGEIFDADAAAEIENPACGDILRLTMKVRDGRIVDVRFKAKGCVAAMACGSALTEIVTGKTVREAQALRREQITVSVGGLPQASTHAAQLALDALSAALNQIR